MWRSAWVRLSAMLAVVLVLGLVACEASGGSGNSAATSTAATDVASASSAGSGDGTTDVTEPIVSAPDAATVPAAAQKVALARTLRNGARGDDVKMVQQRLVEMKFDPGQPDGVYGPATTMAVWAYQKLVLGAKGKDVTGRVSPELWDRMQDPLLVEPRRKQATAVHFEVYLPEQVGVLFEDGSPKLITHISTGNGKDWCANGKCGLATTPGGTFKFYRRESGWWEGSLGKMYNPVYFNYGVAVHGMQNVPSYPASHGCVRIPMHIAEYFPTLVKRGDQVFVWDGVKEPEAYGAQPPPFDRPDPDATTTTVAPPPTTAKVTTTLKPGATTTAKPGAATTTKPGATTSTKPGVASTTAKPTTTAPPTTPPPATTTTTTASTPPSS